MSGLRILQFITPNGFYGAERWVLAMANNLSDQTEVCDLAVTQERATQDLTIAEVYPTTVGQVHRIPMKGRFDLSVVNQLATTLQTRRIDVLHTHGYKSDIIGYLAARKAGVTCVSTPHGYPTKAGLKMGLFIKAGLLALKRFDAIAPLSPELMKDMERFKIPSSKVHFIENGVDLTELEAHRKVLDTEANTATASKPKPLTAPHLGYVGQLITRKGIADMIRMFERVWQKYPNAKLTLVGDGHERADLEALAKSLPCAERIQFLGFRSDRLELVKTFDAFLMTSSLEGIPRCLMEAMAIGTPVVAYDIPGVNELIQHGETGLLAPLGKVAELAEQVILLAENPEQRIRMALNARKLVDERFSARRMASEYETLFSQLLQQHRGAA